VYRATQTVDPRYSGSTTVHTRDAPKLGLRGEFGDIQTYSYAAGTTPGQPPEHIRYAYDALGVFLDADTSEATGRDPDQLPEALRPFLPVHSRVIVIDPLKPVPGP
jgi:hypothetical protein